MTSVAETRKEIVRRLCAAGIEPTEAACEAKMILEDILEATPARLILEANKPLTDEQAIAVGRIVRRREARVPLQYCLGHAWFMGSKLIVREGVFIPRTDTETLVEVAEQIIKDSNLKGALIAEIGTGSGAISVALLKLLPDLRIVACDVDKLALAVAKENARRHAVENRLTLVEGDWRRVLPPGVNGIISNPPYIPREQKQSLEPEVRDYEPESALFGSDSDGLGFYREIARACSTHLKGPGGFAAVEVGDGQDQKVRALFLGNQCTMVDIHRDVNGLPRVVSAHTQ